MFRPPSLMVQLDSLGTLLYAFPQANSGVSALISPTCSEVLDELVKMMFEHGIRTEIDKSEQESGPSQFRRLDWRERCWKSSKLVHPPKDNLNIYHWKHRLRMVSYNGTAWLIFHF